MKLVTSDLVLHSRSLGGTNRGERLLTARLSGRSLGARQGQDDLCNICNLGT